MIIGIILFALGAIAAFVLIEMNNGMMDIMEGLVCLVFIIFMVAIARILII